MGASLEIRAAADAFKPAVAVLQEEERTWCGVVVNNPKGVLKLSSHSGNCMEPPPPPAHPAPSIDIVPIPPPPSWNAP